MKIKSITSKAVYDMDFTKSGENLGTCPDCSASRKNKKAKCFSFNVAQGVGYCSHCESRFVEFKPFGEQQYHKPVFDDRFVDLREEWVKGFLEKRSIGEHTLKSMKVSEVKAWMPQTQKEETVIAYPYFRDGELINVKYRGANKTFKLESGAELCWYNFDQLSANEEVTVTEGEIDTLSFIEVGIKNVVSVPNGASIGKMEYFDNSIHLLDKIKKFYICVDNDEKGILLRDELIRRLGDDRCYVCNLRQYKDANELLVAEGREALVNVIREAKNAKIEGLVELSDFEAELDDLYENGQQPGLSIGVDFIDRHVTWEVGRLCVASGTPSCFTKEQLIHTKFGIKPISEIEIGDMVLSHNHHTKNNEYKTVLNVIKNKDTSEKLLKITLKDGTIIKVTENHKFFTGTSYVKIKDLLLSSQKNNHSFTYSKSKT